jgi:uncharacterized protein
MSQKSPPASIIADPFKFAADSRALQGEVAVADLRRLVDALADGEGRVVWSIEGSMADGEPRLLVRADAVLNLSCQRCLGAMAWPLAVETVLQPVRAGQPIPDEELEDDAVDAIELEGELDALGLVEDEILLALPIAPRHENCEPPLSGGGSGKESPFAALESLRGSNSAK